MADQNQQVNLDSIRTYVIVVYGLIIGGMATGGLLTIAGVILAYFKRGDAIGTIYQSHFSNAIKTFWISSLLALVGLFTMFIYIGWLILIGTTIYCLVNYIKGIVRAVDRQAYK